jgi:hypothetical protein
VALDPVRLHFDKMACQVCFAPHVPRVRIRSIERLHLRCMIASHLVHIGRHRVTGDRVLQDMGMLLFR